MDRSTNARKRTSFHDEDKPDENVNEMKEADECLEEAHFRKHIFYVVLDNVINGLTVRFRFLIPSSFFGTTKR